MQRRGDFLKELDMTEGRSTGIPRMIKALKQNESPLPVFHTDKDRSFLTVEFPIHPSFLEGVVGLDHDQSDKSKVKSNEKSTVQSKVKSNEKVVRLIAENHAITAQEIAESLGLSLAGIEKIIRTLKQQERLRRIGPDKGGHWEIVG